MQYFRPLAGWYDDGPGHAAWLSNDGPGWRVHGPTPLHAGDATTVSHKTGVSVVGIDNIVLVCLPSICETIVTNTIRYITYLSCQSLS